MTQIYNALRSVEQVKASGNLEVRENEVYTGDEAKQILKISQSTFGRLVKRGVLKAAKVGGQYRVLGREILALVSPEIRDKMTGLYRQVKDRIVEWEVDGR